VRELLEAIGAELGERGRRAVEDEERALRVAIVGRPNVGKSSLVNRLVGEERVMVSDVPGTTRDAIDTLIRIGERRYLLIDTAGMRRPGRVRERVERFSVVRARANLARCDVAVVVLDAAEGLAAQDAHIAGYVHEAHKPLVVAVNKWDLLEDRERQAKEWEERVRERLRFAKQVPLVLMSALTGQRATKVLERADEVWEQSGIRVPTPDLNRWLERAARLQTGKARNPFRVYYGTQTGIHPPHFVFFCNDPKKAHFSFRRYLENGLRETFSFGASPLRIDFRARSRRET